MHSSQSSSENGRESYSPRTLVDHLGGGDAPASSKPTHERGSPETRRALTDRPAISYTTLISEALEASPRGRMLLSEIYTEITTRYPYYRLADPGWKNSVRHALSASPCFVSIALPGSGSPGTTPGSRRRYEWALRARAMTTLRGQSRAGRSDRDNDRGTPCERPETPENWSFACPPGAQSMMRSTSLDPFLPSLMARRTPMPAHRATRTIGIEADVSCVALECITSGLQFSPPCHLSDL